MIKKFSNYFFQIIFCGILVTNVWANESNIDTGRRLNEEMDNLVATDAAWKANDKEFRAMRDANKTSDLEIEEFAKYVANLKRQVFVGCEAVRVLGGNAKEKGVDCVEIENDPKIKQEKALSSVKREDTREEQADKLGNKLKKLESEFDGMIMDQQAMIKKEVQKSESYGSWSTPSESFENEREEKSITEKVDQNELGSGPGLKKENDMPDFKVEKGGDPQDDDIIARQLREAAEAETDPVLKEQLWKEYQNYKKSIR